MKLDVHSGENFVFPFRLERPSHKCLCLTWAAHIEQLLLMAKTRVIPRQEASEVRTSVMSPGTAQLFVG